MSEPTDEERAQWRATILKIHPSALAVLDAAQAWPGDGLGGLIEAVSAWCREQPERCPRYATGPGEDATDEEQDGHRYLVTLDAGLDRCPEYAGAVARHLVGRATRADIPSADQFLAWREKGHMPEVSCPSINIARDYIYAQEPSLDRDAAIDALEETRDINQTLRELCLDQARQLFGVTQQE